jgi:hypothetical protein
LRRHVVAGRYLFHILVSGDVDLQDPIMRLWGWFTRFDPDADLHPAAQAGVRSATVWCSAFPSSLTPAGKKGIPSRWPSIRLSSGGWINAGAAMA